MKKYLLFFLLALSGSMLFAQTTFYQYFDGTDTNANNSLLISIDTASGNIWQVGQPTKNIFDAAATLPNVIVTDTLNFYPVNNTSAFEFAVDVQWNPWGIMAVQWAQKLDMEAGKDGGKIEYSFDRITWYNVFNNPYVYNFYGFQNSNQDTLVDGTFCFSGTDSVWRDVWLCYDNSWASTMTDTLYFKYTFLSDSSDTQQEGWMIDNLFFHITWVHTVNEMEDEYMKVYPNLTNGVVHIKTQKMTEYHIIEKMELRDANGRLVQTFGISPTKFSIDIGHHSDGIYFLMVQTNIKSEIFKIILKH